MNDDHRRLIIVMCIAFLISFCIYALLNYDCNVSSDAMTYLNFGGSLAKGNYYFDYPPEKAVLKIAEGEADNTILFRHLLLNGKSISFVGIGYPLFLAMFIGAGGIFAPIFANTLVYILLFLSIYGLTNQIFINHSYRGYISLTAILLFFLVIRADYLTLGPHSAKSFLQPFRDPLSFLFVTSGYYFFLKFTNKQRIIFLMVSTLLIGFACTVRETSVISAVPLGLLFIAKYFKEKQIKFIRHGLLAILFFIVGVSPLLVQNKINTGRFYYSTQMLWEDVKQAEDVRAVDKENSGKNFMPGIHYKNFPRTSKEILRTLYKQYKIICLLLLLSGIYFGRKSLEIKYLAVPFIILYFLFFGSYNKNQWRYIAVIHMMVVPVISLGAIEFCKLIKLKRFLSIGMFFFFIFVIYSMLINAPDKLFQVDQARRFKVDFEESVPADSAVIAERRMRSIIDYFTTAHAFRPDDFVRPRYGVTLKSGIESMLDTLPGVYYFDNEDLDEELQHRFNHTPVTRQMILEHFNLVPERHFHGANYNLEYMFGKEFCTLSKIERWKDRTVVFDIEIAEPKDSVLIINARELWGGNVDRNYAHLYLNEEMIGDSISNGINYVFLSKSMLQDEGRSFTMISDAPLPGNMEPQVLNMYDDVEVDFGIASVPLDIHHISREGLVSGYKSNPSFRRIVSGARVEIPTIRCPGSTIMLVCRMGLETEDDTAKCTIEFKLNGNTQSIVEAMSRKEFNIFSFPLNDKDIAGDVSDLEIDILMTDDQGRNLSVSDAYLAVDKFIVQRYDNNAEQLFIDVGENDLMFIHSGLYNKEKHLKENTIRWTSGTSVINLPFFVPGEAQVLTIDVWGRPKTAGEPVCEVFINDTVIGEFKVASESKQTFSFTIPKHILINGFNELTLITPAWKPSDVLGVIDQRELGIMLDSITLGPINDNSPD
jgi:hypothetical protein